MTASADLLRRTVKSYEKDIIKFSRDLIAIPGFSGTEGNVCKRIAQEMRKVGFDKVWFDKEGDYLEVIFDQRPGYCRETSNPHVMEKVDEKGNVLGFSVMRVSALHDVPMEVAL